MQFEGNPKAISTSFMGILAQQQKAVGNLNNNNGLSKCQNICWTKCPMKYLLQCHIRIPTEVRIYVRAHSRTLDNMSEFIVSNKSWPCRTCSNASWTVSKKVNLIPTLWLWLGRQLCPRDEEPMGVKNDVNSFGIQQAQHGFCLLWTSRTHSWQFGNLGDWQEILIEQRLNIVS